MQQIQSRNKLDYGYVNINKNISLTYYVKIRKSKILKNNIHAKKNQAQPINSIII